MGAGGTPARCRTESCGTEWKTQEGEQKVSSGHFLRGETLVRGFPVCEAPTEAVDLRGRGGSLCPPVKWNHPQSKNDSFGMNYRREGVEPLPYILSHIDFNL